MNQIIASFILLLVPFSSFLNQENENIIDICPHEDPAVCPIPFDTIYSYRRYFVGKTIELQGFLVAEIRHEAISSNARAILLFASFEHATACNIRFSIRIIPTSDDVTKELEKHYGQFTHVWGQFEKDQENRYWGNLKVTRWHSSFEHEGRISSCARPHPLNHANRDESS